MNKLTKMYLKELKGAKEYLHMATIYPDKANFFRAMHDNEKKNAEYLLQIDPNIEEEIEDLKDLLNM